MNKRLSILFTTIIISILIFFIEVKGISYYTSEVNGWIGKILFVTWESIKFQGITLIAFILLISFLILIFKKRLKSDYVKGLIYSLIYVIILSFAYIIYWFLR